MTEQDREKEEHVQTIKGTPPGGANEMFNKGWKAKQLGLCF